MTSKFQVTLPKAIADQYRIRPGDEIDWLAAGDIIRVIPPGRQPSGDDVESRLRLFDQASERIRQRDRIKRRKRPVQRGWERQDLYTRGRSN